MLELLATWIVWIALFAATLAVGRPLARWLGIERDDIFATLVWSMGLGLLAWGMLLTGLGLAGMLYRTAIAILTAVAACWGTGEAFGLLATWRTRHLAREEQASAESNLSPCPPPAPWCLCGVGLLALIAVGASFISACAPPTAGDALCYHLDLPKQFLAEHAIVDVPYNDNATYPLLVEMWYAWGLALEGGVSAQLFHWVLGLLFAGATVLLARPILGHDWAWMAGAAALLIPGVTNQMTAPLNDIALAALTTLSLVAWRAASDPSDDGLSPRQRTRLYVLAGLMFGAAMSTKYVAMLFALAVAAEWGYRLYRQTDRRREYLSGACLTLAAAICVAGAWYARAYWLRGNPVYPFLGTVMTFDGAEYVTGADKTPLSRTPWSFVAAPLLVTFHPDRFGGRGHELGPLLLAMLPCLIFVRRLRGLTSLLAIAGVYGLLWFLLRQNVRFLYPAVPLFLVAAVWLWMELPRLPQPPRAVAGGVLTFMLLLGAVWPLYRARDKFAVAVGLESREAFLLRMEPTYEAAFVVNHLLPRGAHVLSQDYRGFYFNCPVTRESIYRRETAYDRSLTERTDPDALAHELRRRGFTHVLVASNETNTGIHYEPTLARLLAGTDSQPAGRSLARLANYGFLDTDGARRRYQLYLLR
ncbi:MAG: glycosyltransferase family 39 protein [Pirellulales bacterium]|nr:glycosyltransferase family 39 protein [Pirellulales bacterium]